MTATHFIRVRSLDRPGYVRLDAACHRCGGTGIYSQFHGTCFRCGGNGREPQGERTYCYPAGWTDEECAAHAAKLDARRVAAADRKAAKAAAELEDFLADRPELAAAFARRGEFDGFVWDVLDRLARFGSLTDRQVEAVVEAVRKADEAKARRAEEDAAEAAAAQPVPAGRVVLEGEVLTLRLQEGMYGTVQKLLLKGEGWKVWGTVPRGLYPERGDLVRLTATVEPSADDPSFGFYTRPTKAEVLQRAEASAA